MASYDSVNKINFDQPREALFHARFDRDEAKPANKSSANAKGFTSNRRRRRRA